ncbi:MAG TPA: serine/threonine-protein kinase, partial [Polyangia bacterium]
MQLTTRRRASLGAAAAVSPLVESVSRIGFMGVLGAFGALSWVRRRRAEKAAARTRLEHDQLEPDDTREAEERADRLPEDARAERNHEPPVLHQAGQSVPHGLEQFGPYRLIERIGEGGMAEVFSAVATGVPGATGRPLVVKRLREELSTNPVAITPFLDEGELVFALRHPNIVGVLDFGAVDGRHYIAADYVAGRDTGRLARRMVDLRQRPMSPAAICYLAQEVLCGLAHAHHRVDADGRPLDLVHRDITPENVMITLAGEVMLLDFGIARPHFARPEHDTEGVKGNVDFMSPEQARGMHVDRRSDLFSLGLVMYFCAARAPLYRGRTIYDRLIAAANGPGAADQDFVA